VPRTAKLVVLTYYNWRELVVRKYYNWRAAEDEALKRQHGNISGMRAYADVCGRMLTYADEWTRPSRDSTATLVVLKFYETVLKYYN